MSKNIDLYGLLTAALESHVSRDHPDAYKGSFTDFSLDTDVIVRPPFGTYRPPFGTDGNPIEVDPAWDGTTGTRKYMFFVSIEGAPVHMPTPEGKEVKVGEIYPYKLFNGEPIVEADDSGRVSLAINSCDFSVSPAEPSESLSLYSLLALVAAQDAQDAETAQALREAVVSNVSTCGLSVEERKELLRLFTEKRKPYYRRKDHNVRTTRQVALIDPLTNAITDAGKGAITPADYFTEEGREIDTGNGGVALLDIRASSDADLEDMSTYVADNSTRFWLDHLYPLILDAADSGYEVHGSELLKHAGIKNPYDRQQEHAMRDAAKNIDKALKTRIGIDVTREKRSKRRGNRTLIESIELRPIVDGIMTIDRYEEGGEEVRDFTITVKPRAGEEVIDALPLAKYAQSRGMLTNYTQDEITFTGIRQMLDDRRMWAYVLRRVKTRNLSETIRFDTMWNDLKVDVGLSKEASRKKRVRMLKKLERMLDQKKGELFSSWTWKKDADGRVEGIRIRRKKSY